MAEVKGPRRLGSLVAGAQALEPNLSLSLSHCVTLDKSLYLSELHIQLP